MPTQKNKQFGGGRKRYLTNEEMRQMASDPYQAFRIGANWRKASRWKRLWFRWKYRKWRWLWRDHVYMEMFD